MKTTKEYIIEGNIISKGTTIIENYGSDLPNVQKYSEPLSKIKGKGIEGIAMDYRDHHQAYFYNGLLCGFAWFGKIYISNHYPEFSKEYSHVINNGLSNFTNSRPADMFTELYGKEGEVILSDAIEYYKTFEER